MWGQSQEPGDFYSHAVAAQIRHLIREALLRLKTEGILLLNLSWAHISLCYSVLPSS